MWHLEPIVLLARQVGAESDFDKRTPFGGIATVNLLEPGRAFVRGALRRQDDGALRLQDFVELCERLRDRHGVHTIESDRHGKVKTWDVHDVIVRGGQRALRR